MPKLLPLKDFRARRRVLTKDDFAIAGDDIPPQDLIAKSIWYHLTTLPTDLAIQTSDHNGTRLKLLCFLSSLWLEAIDSPEDDEKSENDITFVPMLSAMEEFEAALFNAFHGFYRQSIGCARNALEVMTVGSACHALKRHDQFRAWQDGDKKFGFGAACDLLIGAKSLQELRKLLADRSNDSLFDQKAGGSDGGCIRRLYDKLSKYSHSRPGFTSRT